jgi:endonuclease YncB( thermonuclease family)
MTPSKKWLPLFGFAVGSAIVVVTAAIWGQGKWVQTAGPSRSLPLAVVSSGAEDSFSGLVIGVRDGDGLMVKHAGLEWEIRLYGIDAPEKGQPYYLKAGRFLSGLARNKIVTVIPRERDQYQRIVAEVRLADGRSLNEEVVAAGLAWWFRRYAPENKRLADLESLARAAKRGLWSEPEPVPPWEWRRKLRETSSDAAAGFCASRNSKVYHRCSCPSVTAIRPENLLIFPTEEEARKSGRHRCKCQ